MLLFVSGRTDIPAFYSEWFFNRVKAGFLDVRNPFNNSAVSRYKLTPDLVDCLVFCTKNPAPMLSRLSEIQNFGKYVFVTITPYGRDIEPNVPEKSEVIKSFQELSKQLGKDCVCWRYDPILVNEKYSVAFHIKAFRQMCSELASYTDRCIISFIELFEKVKRNFPEAREVSEADQKFLAGAFSSIAREYGITVENCAGKTDLSAQGVIPASCVSKDVIQKATGKLLKDSGIQKIRENCLCLPMRDTGYYNSCPHLCRYCYANYDEALVSKTVRQHDPSSTFLIGGPEPGDKITISDQKSLRDFQTFLF